MHEFVEENGETVGDKHGCQTLTIIVFIFKGIWQEIYVTTLIAEPGFEFVIFVTVINELISLIAIEHDITPGFTRLFQGKERSRPSLEGIQL